MGVTEYPKDSFLISTISQPSLRGKQAVELSRVVDEQGNSTLQAIANQVSGTTTGTSEVSKPAATNKIVTNGSRHLTAATKS